MGKKIKLVPIKENKPEYVLTPKTRFAVWLHAHADAIHDVLNENGYDVPEWMWNDISCLFNLDHAGYHARSRTAPCACKAKTT